MNTKKLMGVLILFGISTQVFAGSQDYYDFRWELKKLEEKSQYRDPSEFNQKITDTEVIELKNEPIVFEIKDDLAKK